MHPEDDGRPPRRHVTEWEWSKLPTLAGSIAGATGLIFLVAWLRRLAAASTGGDVSTAVLGADLNMFLAAGDLARSDRWSTVYSPARFSDFVGSLDQGASFAYPPPFAQMMSIVPDIGFEALALGWAGASALIFLAAIPLLIGADALKYVAFMLLPIYAALQLGQTTAIAALLAALAVRFVRSGHAFAAGLTAGFLVYKVPLVAGPVGLSLTRRAGRFRYGVWSAIAVVAAASLALSAGAWREYFAGLAESGANTNVTTRWDLSLTAALGQLLGPLEALTLFAIVVSLIGVWLIWRLRHHVIDETMLALALLLSVLASPRMLVYDWAILIIPLTILHRSFRHDRWISTATAAVLVAPLAGLPPLTVLSRAGVPWLSLFWLLLLVVRRVAQDGTLASVTSVSSQ